MARDSIIRNILLSSRGVPGLARQVGILESKRRRAMNEEKMTAESIRKAIAVVDSSIMRINLLKAAADAGASEEQINALNKALDDDALVRFSEMIGHER
jgi:hypothetical protein